VDGRELLKNMNKIDFGKFIVELQKDYYKTYPIVTVSDSIRILEPLGLNSLIQKYETKEYSELELKWSMLLKINNT
jgi:hypothetical protein